MNIQDIADFLDLVKNPDKYQARLDALKEEQGRLNAVIETVGKASELDKLRKDLEAQRSQLQTDFDKATQERDAQIEREVATLAKQRAELADVQRAADSLNLLSNQRLQEAKDLVDSFAGREKILKQGEDGLVVRQKQLDALIAEYNEKVAKLRSVMV